MEATDYNHRGHKAFATSRSRGMRILSPAGRFGRLRLPPGCRPDRPHITPVRRLTRKLRPPIIPTVIVAAVIVSAMVHTAPSRRCLVRDPGVTGAIRKALRPRIAAEPDIGPKIADRPAAVLLAQLEQRASMLAAQFWFGREHRTQGPQKLTLACAPRTRGLRVRCPSGQSLADAVLARQIETGELADHGVAADADVGGDLPAREPGLKAAFQELDTFGSPGGFSGKHDDGPKVRLITS